MKRSKRPAAEPALLGGSPVRKNPFPPYPILGAREKKAVLAVLENGMLSGFPYDFLGGPQVREFEKRFADYFDVPFAVAVNSGTAALHVALAAADIGPGDEVIVPCYTFTATATAVLHQNAVPIFIDVDPRTFCVTAELVEAAITPRTKAVIPVHFLGNVCRMDKIMDVARRHKLAVIEDNAQSPGAKFRNRFAGTWGDAGTFSFVETKNLVTGEGGMVLTRRADIAERARLVRNHGECHVAGKPRSYIANILGWNYRMTEMEAAIGCAQLAQFDGWTKQRRANAEYLNKHLKLPGISIPFKEPEIFHVYHLYALLYDDEIVGIPRALFQQALLAEGVPCSLGYPHPLYRNPLFQTGSAYGRGSQNYRELNLRVAEELCGKKALWLPVIRPPATERDMQDVVEAFRKVYDARMKLRDLKEKESA